MQSAVSEQIITAALDTLAQENPQDQELPPGNAAGTKGKWLERVTAAVAPLIKDWDIARAWLWDAWPDRQTYFPNLTAVDTGIDVVAIANNGDYIAIQCKARKLDAAGRGNNIQSAELNKFTANSFHAIWTERWLVTNGDNQLSPNSLMQTAYSDPNRPVKLINIHADLLAQQTAAEPEPYSPGQLSAAVPDPDNPPRQTKQCMQDEAVAASVRLLREQEQSASGGLPVGQARGKIILPCGTGKTRISLRIVEELTPPGSLSIVLCPSIALVAQIRREYLQHARPAGHIRALAVCSDETAGYDPKKESTRNTAADPTLDNSNFSAAEVKGKVTTEPAEIGRWIRDGQDGPDAQQISVIFGTYQSGHRIAAALRATNTTARVLIADEAHRTAGLRRKRSSRQSESQTISPEEQRLRDFTLCHDNDEFPATYRIYQTATPRIYDTSRVRQDLPSDWIVRSMDDETTFGVELYRKSYVEAVNNGWLADYRIIAVGVNDPDAFHAANNLAAATQSKGKQSLTTAHFLKGMALALALGGATQTRDNGNIPIKSCIAFMNTVDKSKNMAADLQTATVMDWLQKWLDQNRPGQTAARYTLEHLDASSNVTARENAKRRLLAAADADPHGIINVGIFGEGTDSPSLNAVAFLEARRSPIDVIQAVGRAMRTAPGKEVGYIICPILINPTVDPETWLSSSGPEDGWQELGQILLALRAHDSRIEDNLAELLQLYIPQPPPLERTIVAIARREEQRIAYREHIGRPGAAQQAVTRVLEGKSTLTAEFPPIVEPAAPPARSEPESAAIPEPAAAPALNISETAAADYQVPAAATAAVSMETESADTAAVVDTPPAVATDTAVANTPPEPTQVIAGKLNADGSKELRLDTVARGKPAPDGTPGPVDFAKSKGKGRDMINKGTGIRLDPEAPARHRPTRQERAEQSALRQLELSGLSEHGNAIRMNLLTKSGLTANRTLRDLNILEAGIKEAAHHLRSDELLPALNRHFGLDNLTPESRANQADGCTIAALLLMNAAMLHQRIVNGAWLPGIGNLSQRKNDGEVVRNICREWERIMRYDFRPVLEPALEAIYALEHTGKLDGLVRALHIIAAEAERIAETYADLGADHAGPLFNRVMGNQASDGAFFTRPVAASIAARLTLDAADPNNAAAWTDPNLWRAHKAVDLACGSGTLLAALLAELKRRAQAQGASPAQLAELQKTAVEETLKGLDINPVSLQLAAAQLTAGNHDIRYRKMGLHLMPYGPQTDNPARIAAGTLELLGQQAIVPRRGAMNLGDDKIQSQTVWPQGDDAELEDAVAAVKDARIVIMNPPFTNRNNMGEKFPKGTQQALRARADSLERALVDGDPTLANFVDKTALGPLFVVMAEKCTQQANDILTMLRPTIALSSPSGYYERQILAQRYHIHTVLSCHQPGNVNLSQSAGINESIIVTARCDGPKPPTRFINLDRLPFDDAEVAELHRCLADCPQGSIADGWGQVCHWPADRIAAGDWTPAIWRSPELAAAAARLSENTGMPTLQESGLAPVRTDAHKSTGFEKVPPATPGSFPVVHSKSTDGQTCIQGQPDQYMVPQNRDENTRQANGGIYPEVDQIMQKAGHLMITAGQNNSTARLTALASDSKFVGNGYIPVPGLPPTEAKALAVFLNSTLGRLQLLRNQGRTLVYPKYHPAGIGNIRIPNLQDAGVCQILADCWEQTKGIPVPQFRDGECAVRRQWDAAVAQAMNWDAAELTRLRLLLHQEPHIRGLGYNQYGDAVEADAETLETDAAATLQAQFTALAAEWRRERPRGQDIAAMTAHPAYQRIIAMGAAAVPWILESLAAQPEHWFVALNAITGADPVPESSRGRLPEMAAAWLEWGRQQGYRV